MTKQCFDRLWSALAVLLCAIAAWAVSLIQWRSWRVFVPFAFLLFVLALGFVYGRMVGILGSIIAALVFAHSLYEPIGSLRVEQQTARSSLAWMLLAGVSLSYLLLPSSTHRQHK